MKRWQRAAIPVALVFSVLAAGLVRGVVHAQNYPHKPIRMIVPFSPGGSLDLVARIIARSASAELTQQVVVENRAGAGGTIGVDLVAKSPPDGYTLLIVQSSITVNPSLLKNVPYDPVRDFDPISKVSSYMMFLVAHPSTGLHSVKQLIALAKAKPGELNYASVGVGSATHLSAALFDYMAGIKMTHVPYKGTGQVMPDLLGGQVALHFGSTSVVPYAKSGKLVALGVTGEQRSPALPDVPTIAEAGVPGYEVTTWNALFAPTGTPAPIITRLNGLVRQALDQADAKAVMAAQGLDPTPGTPSEMRALVKSELSKWARLIKAANIRPD